MNLLFSTGTKSFKTNLNEGIDISLSFGPGGDNPNAFHIPPPNIEPIRVGSFVGSVKQGSGANCDTVLFCAHGNTTHIECVGHISANHESVGDCIHDFLMLADVISVELYETTLGQCITVESLAALPEMPSDAIVVRTLPNSTSKKSQIWSGKNPPFFSLEAMQILRQKGYKHLLTDLPSVDPEEDNGALAAHHIWWDFPENPRMQSSITELIFVPDSVADGQYLLMMQFPNIKSDASPCRPVLYPISNEV